MRGGPVDSMISISNAVSKWCHDRETFQNSSAITSFCNSFEGKLLQRYYWNPAVKYSRKMYLWLFSCDQAALWMVQSVCPSVCPSVRPSVRPSVTPFWLCSHHPVIMKFSGVITSDKSDVHAKGQGQRSKVKVTEVTTQLNRFRTVTPV